MKVEFSDQKAAVTKWKYQSHKSDEAARRCHCIENSWLLVNSILEPTESDFEFKLCKNIKLLVLTIDRKNLSEWRRGFLIWLQTGCELVVDVQKLHVFVPLTRCSTNETQVSLWNSSGILKWDLEAGGKELTNVFKDTLIIFEKRQLERTDKVVGIVCAIWTNAGGNQYFDICNSKIFLERLNRWLLHLVNWIEIQNELVRVKVGFGEHWISEASCLNLKSKMLCNLKIGDVVSIWLQFKFLECSALCFKNFKSSPVQILKRRISDLLILGYQVD